MSGLLISEIIILVLIICLTYWLKSQYYAKFTEYQKSATGFLKMPFKLFEVAKYENGLFSINEINNNKIKDETNTVRINESDKVESEIIVYTEEDHLKKMNETLKEIYANLKEKVVNAFDIDIEAKKHYIAFKHNNF